MTLPTFLSSSFGYSLVTQSTDVQDAIDGFRTLAVAQSWTNPGGAGRFVSPVDAVGRFMDITLTRIDIHTLELTVGKDMNGVDYLATVNPIRIMNSATAGVKNDWDIFAGQFHFCINTFQPIPSPATLYQEAIIGGILDLSPEAQNAHSRHTWFSAPRNNLSANQSRPPFICAMIDNNTPAFADRKERCLIQGGSSECYVTTNNYLVSRPLDYHCQKLADGVGVFKYCGRCYQMLTVHYNVGYGVKVVLPLDATTTGTFKTVGIGDGSVQQLVAVRMA